MGDSTLVVPYSDPLVLAGNHGTGQVRELICWKSRKESVKNLGRNVRKQNMISKWISYKR